MVLLLFSVHAITVLSFVCSLFAAKAGASRVVAVEASEKMAKVASKVTFFYLLQDFHYMSFFLIYILILCLVASRLRRITKYSMITSIMAFLKLHTQWLKS